MIVYAIDMSINIYWEMIISPICFTIQHSV